MDHYLWRHVGRDFKMLEESAPQGYKPVVEVTVAGEKHWVNWVETLADRPWAHLQWNDPAGDADHDTPVPADRVLYVHESAIAAVEIRFIEVKQGEARTGLRVA